MERKNRESWERLGICTLICSGERECCVLQFLDLLWSGARGLAGPGWRYICHRDAKLLDLWLMYNSVYKRVHKFEVDLGRRASYA